MVNAWSAGHYGNEPPEDKGKRLVRICWVRTEPRDNGYARPVENLVAVVNLNRKQLVRLEDYGALPLPPSLATGHASTRRRRAPTSSPWMSSSPKARVSRCKVTR